MGALHVLQKDRTVSLCLSRDELPDFYMNDFSVLGLLVSDLEATRQVIADKDFAVYRESDYLKLNIDRFDHLLEIVTRLKHNGIDCEVTDIVDQVYQG